SSRGDYLSAERRGRGVSPRMDRQLREAILAGVIGPYGKWKREAGLVDWNDLAVALATIQRGDPYHIVVVDEAQDFSANQARAVINHMAEEHSLTWIVDAAQRIYPRFFTWREVGLSVGPRNSRQLSANHRNTKQIAAFAKPLLTG